MSPRATATLTAVVEAVVAAGLTVLAVRWWHRGMIATEVAGVELFRVDGRWWFAAVLVATAAGLALIDAARRLALARRASTGDRPDAGEADLTPPPPQDHR